MQRFRIIHKTRYSYNAVVTLGSHQLLLRPREDHEVRIESFSLRITPDAQWLWHRDVEGNSVAVATFSRPASELLIESDVIIQQYNEMPLNFEMDAYALWYPFVYLPEDDAVLQPYRILPTQETCMMLSQWIEGFWKHGEAIQTYVLLQRLNTFIHDTLRYQIREEPGVQSVRQTLSLGSGSCRDFALLFMTCARYLGLASRFVSGYLYAPMMRDFVGATHAWAEVYLPGAGWKGFDPTGGTIVGSDHIPVAVSRLAESVPPIAGIFTGVPGSRMEVEVAVTRC